MDQTFGQEVLGFGAITQRGTVVSEWQGYPAATLEGPLTSIMGRPAQTLSSGSHAATTKGR